MTYVAPSVKVIDSAIDFSNDIVTLAIAVPERWSHSSVGPNREHNDEVRTSSEMHIPFGIDYPKEFFLLAQAIYIEAIKYAQENGFEFSHMESLSLLRYTAGQGFYDRHIDAGDSTPRSMSALLYLNDVDEGGETYFDKFDLWVSPKAGKLVLFPANYPYSHQAMPPVSNDKYVIVTWFGIKQNENVFEGYYANTRR